MMLKERARQLITQFKGEDYLFGLQILDQVGGMAARLGNKALLIGSKSHQEKAINKIIQSLEKNNVSLAGERIVPGAKPNTPREDVYRIETYILHYQPDFLLAIGGGSTIDCVKAADVLAILGAQSPEIEDYFGTGLVSASLQKFAKQLKPFLAIQTSASSAAHLTKYSNVSDPVAGQKKLIVDEALVPDKAVFDYALTASMPADLTIDGALDGISHVLEVFYGIAKDKFDLARDITSTALELILQNTKKAMINPDDLKAREALGLATDLGGYAIMIGGTSGPHLTSFSLVDIASHGRACGIMNPYYTVFFAPAIEKQLQLISEILQRNNLLSGDITGLSGRNLGMAVAHGLVNFSKSIGAPTTLAEIPGFSDQVIEEILRAAKNPQLEMKLKNMPVPLHSSLVDDYMGPILKAAQTGDFSLIKNLD
ncbi:MAG TPA: iron-containing alcohol dehydrogenase [Atribacterota bacterium]|nr:iron-containing alcohol dehydrogenase [Atribacterota bacterium]